ncbi:Hint domain-containing protein [Acetobacteraceae bacterium KSS8]|uniref:Hint domain-containing protein n=1 Tax=Endosaccharibacter trunci TaxID=2812733 RepID=A0ABT1W346_9PROT|nr:Hint domain-containing protein [Acetobacteraceae bacterium KSS8]
MSDFFGVVTVSFSSVCCFAAGTMIETVSGPRAVETLAEGDQLWAFGAASLVLSGEIRRLEIGLVAVAPTRRIAVAA